MAPHQGPRDDRAALADSDSADEFVDAEEAPMNHSEGGVAQGGAETFDRPDLNTSAQRVDAFHPPSGVAVRNKAFSLPREIKPPDTCYSLRPRPE